MKRILDKSCYRIPCLLLFILLLLPPVAHADPGNQYCVTPPFITAGLKPNLLMMIDNSASMYDLASIDMQNYCANASITACTSDATCAALPTGQCVTAGTACTSDVNCPFHCVKNSSTVCTTDANCLSGDKCGKDFCNNKCNTQHVCWDNTYDDTAVYAGYYDQAAVYQYDFTNKKFTSGATMPGTCIYSAGTTKYVCVDTVLDVVTGFKASGKFLNWLTASNFDIEKKILTGGKYDTVKSVLAAETRGCSGRKFMKTLDAMPGITFAISGGTASTLGLTSNSTAYGQTFVQVYKGTYAASSCQDVVSLWKTMTAANQDAVMSALCKCVGGTYNPSGGTFGTGACTVGSSQLKLAPFYQIAYDCACFVGGLCNYSGGGSFQNFTPIQKLCEADYLVNYFDTLGPAGITDPSAPDYICAKLPSSTPTDPKNVGAGCTWNTITSGAQTLTFSATNKTITSSTAGSFNTSPNIFAVGNTIKTDSALNPGLFTIKTVTGTVITVNEALVNEGPVTSKTVTTHTCTWDATGSITIPAQLTYCSGVVNLNPVTDPSFGTLSTAATVSVPGFLVQAGLSGLTLMGVTGDLVDGKLASQIGLAPAPTGLIDKYKDRIRFGAFVFNENGSASECSDTGKCQFTGVSCTSFPNNCATYTLPNTSTAVKQLCVNPFPCGMQCSVTKSQLCYVNSDCPTGETCGAIPKTDGGTIIAYVGAGNCSVTTATACKVDSDCPATEYCAASVGNHTSGLIKAIDDIKATSWTPFAEAFYSAMGYFARSNAYTVSPPTSRSDGSFSSFPSPNTATSYDSTKNPSQYRCQSNNILLVTDGVSTADQNSASEALASLYASQVPNIIAGTTTYGISGYDATNKCPAYSGSRSISDLAWVAKNRNIKTLTTATPASTTSPQASSESITTYVVYSGPQTSSQPGLCDPKTLMTNTATNGGTTLFAATNPSALSDQLDSAFSTVAAKAASGTAASILSNSEGSGANILQAVFYPKKIFDSSTAVSWIGEMQNLWYFVDPYIQNSTIREDTDSDLKLHLVNDYVVRFAFDNASDRTMVQRYWDSNGDGIVTDSDKVGGLIDPDYVKSIWRAGMKLWDRTDASDRRTIYTGYNSFADSSPQKFSTLAIDGGIDLWPGVWNALQIPAGTDAVRGGLAAKLINYIRGTDQADDTAPCLNADCTYRNRTVTMGVCSGNHQKRCTTATVATDCPSGNTCASISREWKLGDIISSTPRVQSTVRLNTFNLPSPGGYSDKSYESFINSNDYKSRGMVYVGANDGMLHAFKLGTLSVTASGFQKASLSGTNLGAEQWAFIPNNSIPYLKYFSDKDYSHLYSIDGRTNILDASIGDTNSGTCVRASYWLCDKPRNGSIPMVDASNNLDTTKNTWRTIVIAGMGLGGASRNNVGTETCTEGAAGNCVKTPVSDIGYSSYFALDVTYPDSPKFLWEFSNNLLGYSTSAPAIVRIGDKDKNGRWFAVFGNGPFGPIDPGTHQFKAQSNHHLRFFVVDLRTGDLVRTISFDGIGGPIIDNAFSGALLGASIDADRRDPTKAGNYQDDAIYAGYVTKALDGTWTDGGVVRIMTKEDPNPANWVASKVIEGIGPVTTAIARTQDTRDLNKNLWLYFGTGRYYYRDATTLDDNNGSRSLFGIQEPCYNTTTRPGNVLDSACTATLTAGSLVNQTSSITGLGATNKGWRIDLDPYTTSEGAERVVTDTVALTNGTVFFTSFKPTMDICGYGGSSFLWGVKYDTGGQAAANALTGKALIQLSTGEFKEVDLSTAFTDKLNRRMLSPMTGKPPSDAPPIVSNSTNKPVKKILHIQEH